MVSGQIPVQIQRWGILTLTLSLILSLFTVLFIVLLTVVSCSGIIRYTPPPEASSDIPGNSNDNSKQPETLLENSSVQLSWTAPSQNEDGSALTKLAGFKIYYGLSPDKLDKEIDVANVTTYKIENLSPGTWFFAISSYNESGRESKLSEISSKTIK